ncbi:hypothetical protein I7I50_06148 [Histoplasma capsulatum G186AR]|uniref:Uncharacterized protein n=1 Tax=Ajellomyces capsulatus TaxID=5037 RepID=A0A8H7Z192_AJECA|nr:hypothetical protein I7I52_10774 [Histoplasma capsulatum]QSS67151.1 hypothetical protein I7I50_06148 [Histoplasma capsulatum G186AR]
MPVCASLLTKTTHVSRLARTWLVVARPAKTKRWPAAASPVPARASVSPVPSNPPPPSTAGSSRSPVGPPTPVRMWFPHYAVTGGRSL